MDAIDIEEQEKEVFCREKWISTGQRYNRSTPLHVVNAHHAILTLPVTAVERLPSPELPIVDFLKVKLPVQSRNFNFHGRDSWFYSDPPTELTDDEVVDVVWSRTIPPFEVLDTLQKSAGQTWLDGGAESISDPRYFGSHKQFPLWVLTFWKKLSEVWQIQEEWKECHATLTRVLEKDPIVSLRFDNPEQVFGGRSWNAEMVIGGDRFTNFTFSELLQSSMINDDVTQLMTQHLQCRLEQDMDKNWQHYITASRFASVLEAAASRDKYKSSALPATLKIIEAAVQKMPTLKVWFPALLFKHEMAFCIDFGKRTLAWGDSLPVMPRPQKVIQDAQRWLKERFRGPFEELGNVLIHGEQKDSISCIPATLNTIAHGIFGDPLWTPEYRFVDRIRWFQLLVPDLQDKLSRRPGTSLALSDLLNPQNPAEQAAIFDIISDGYEELHLHDDEEPILSSVIHPSLDGNTTFRDDALIAEPVQGDVKDCELIPKVEDNRAATAAQRNEEAKSAWNALLNGKPSGRKRQAASSSTGTGHKRAKNSGSTQVDVPAGTSKGAISQRKSRARADAGQTDPTRRAHWKERIYELDKYAEFYEDKPRVVRCSHCSALVKVKSESDTSRFVDHQKSCKKNGYDKKKRNVATAHTPTLLSGFIRRNWDLLREKISRAVAGKPKPQPCPGLNGEIHPKISHYLHRSAAAGGGAHSVTRTAESLFNKKYSALTKMQKAEVQLQQSQDFQWRNDHQQLRVYSTSCRKVARPCSSHGSSGQNQPCSQCASLLCLREFKNTIRVPMPADENYKYVNSIYRNEVLGDHYLKVVGLKELVESAKDTKSSVFVKFAQGVLQGKYKDEQVFLGLIQAMVQKIDRKERGVGLQNFRYTPAWDEFIQIVHIHSPRAYRFLTHHFPARTERNLKLKQSRESKLPLTLCSESFERVKTYLDSVDYSGPVAVACDDTKLFSALRLFWDAKKEQYYLVGGVQGPLKVANREDIEKLMNDPKIVKGSKVRLYIIQIPLPKVAPIVLAALPITDTLPVSKLLDLHKQVIHGLLKLNIHVASYSCDGTETERSVQREFVGIADSHITVNIPFPQDRRPPLSIRIPVFMNHPIAVVQDAKHALKTFRNNLFSGARLLVLGNHVAFYQQVRDIAFADSEGSPLYHRDVEKLDRQDDNAAARLFSAATLQYLAQKVGTHNQELLGLAVYLFVFGEVADAYQNRQIGHSERITMLLRARYFVDIWQKFLEDLPCYPRHKYLLSHEAIDIIHFLIDGLISLVIIHRDYYPTIPLLPWLHSTEPCEHFFGLARQHVSDFSLLDFFQMIPKFSIQLREWVMNTHLSETTDKLKARASGYHHTYANIQNLDIIALGCFPSDDQIQRASQRAAEEAQSLWALLGVFPDDLYSERSRDSPMLDPDETVPAHYSDDEEHYIGDSQFDLEMEELQELIHLNESRKDLDSRERERFETLLNASLALAVDDQVRINSLPEVDDEMYENFLAEDRRALEEVNLLAADAPYADGREVDYSVSDTFNGLTLEPLVELREKHQTYHAAHAVRTHGKEADHSEDVDAKQNTSRAIRKEIIHAFNSELKKDQAQGLTTGDDRSTRWTAGTQAGNTANAAAASRATANQAAGKRAGIFKAREVPYYNEGLDTARVSVLSPLKTNDFGFVWTEQGVYLGRVMTMYSKGGGKHGKHAAVAHKDNISALSYLAIQLHEHTYGGRFKNTPSITSIFQARAFVLIDSPAFLAKLSSKVTVDSSTGSMAIVSNDLAMFEKLKKTHGVLSLAMKDFRKRTIQAPAQPTTSST